MCVRLCESVSSKTMNRKFTLIENGFCAEVKINRQSIQISRENNKKCERILFW